jgi:hypothetical protein
MLRWVGNALALSGALAAMYAAYAWWVAANIPVEDNMDSMRDHLIAIAEATQYAAGVTGVSAVLIALGEALRAIAARLPQGRAGNKGSAG